MPVAAATVPFHVAAVADAALDLVEDGAGGELVVEPAADRADVERRDASGATVAVLHARTAHRDTGTILSGDLWDVLRRWCRDGAAGDAAHVFRTDGRLYPSAVAAVADRLARFGAGTPSGEDLAVVAAAGIDPGHPTLRRVGLRTGEAPVAALVDALRGRVGRLLRAGAAGDAVDDAVARLLHGCDTRAGPARLAREDVAGLLGLPAVALDRGAERT